MSWLAGELLLSHNFFDDIMSAREDQAGYLCELVRQYCKSVALPPFVLGTAFKANTSIETGSAAVLCLNLLRLAEQGEVEHSDPFVNQTGHRIPPTPRVFLIGVRHDAFEKYLFPKGSVVIDPWRYIPDQSGVLVVRVGQ